MKPKRYYLRGIGIGIVAYVLFFIVSYVLIFSGVMTCNAFVTIGPIVNESILCGPILTIAGVPLMAIGELGEDVSSGTITHLNLYLGLLGGLVIYFGIFALLGYLYGKNRNRVAK